MQDYSGPRFFVIGTNHEACRSHAMRKLWTLAGLARCATENVQGMEGWPAA